MTTRVVLTVGQLSMLQARCICQIQIGNVDNVYANLKS